LATLAFLAFVLLAPLVAANPSPRWTFDEWWHGLLGIGITNFSINLLFISSVLHLIVRVKGREVGAFNPVQRRFLGQILASNLIITTCGAVIDFWVFYEPYLRGYDFVVSLGGVLLGSLLVSVSVAATCFFVLRLKLLFSFAMASTMGAFNLLSWVVTLGFAFEFHWLLLVIVVAVFSALFTIPMSLLMRWHSMAFVEHAQRDDAARLEDTRILRCNLLCVLGVVMAFAGWLVDEALHHGYSYLETSTSGWFLILMAASTGLVSPLLGGGALLYLVVYTREIEGTGFLVLALCTLVILASFAYPLGKGYEKKRCVLDRVFTFRSAPVSTCFRGPHEESC
jgi:hypothetical protein